MQANNLSLPLTCGLLGTDLAMIISWSLYKSIGWAMLHGIFGWLYVIYYVIWL